MKTIYREIVSALIFSKDGKLLVGMKDPKSGGVYVDCWHIPGGGVEADETKETALYREILEEVGIDISDTKVALVDDQGSDQTEKILKETGEKALCNMKFNVYRVDLAMSAKDIKLQPTDDLATLEWISLDKLQDYKLAPPSISLFKRLGMIQDQDIYKSAGIIIVDRKLLFARAKGMEIFIDPGGQIEPGETSEQALVRELKEELTIDVAETDLEFFGEYVAEAANHKGRTVHMKAFVVKNWQGDIAASSEIETLQWLTHDIPADIKVGSIFGGQILPKLYEQGLVD